MEPILILFTREQLIDCLTSGKPIEISGWLVDVVALKRGHFYNEFFVFGFDERNLKRRWYVRCNDS
jgi:hypothetical protein